MRAEERTEISCTAPTSYLRDGRTDRFRFSADSVDDLATGKGAEACLHIASNPRRADRGSADTRCSNDTSDTSDALLTSLVRYSSSQYVDNSSLTLVFCSEG